MDESWRMKMGIPKVTNVSRRRSTEGRRRTFSGDAAEALLEPEDFSDVFGGPPRSVLSRQFSTPHFPADGSSSSSSSSASTLLSYEDIFRRQEKMGFRGINGRSLPEFRIPGSKSSNKDFYSDVFGWKIEDQEEEELRRSRTRSGSKSKTSSCSVLSSEELSPIRPAIGRDDISLISSKLRPINVPYWRWNSTGKGEEDEIKPRKQQAACKNRPSFSVDDETNHNFKLYEDQDQQYYCLRRTFYGCSSSPAETINTNNSLLEPNKSYCSSSSIQQALADNHPELLLMMNSSLPSSSDELELSSSCFNYKDEAVQEEEEEEEEEALASGYFIEIQDDRRNVIDEAIAWAKEKFQTHDDDDKANNVNDIDK